MYLPAIKGYVSSCVLRMFCAFLEFCYISWHDVVTEWILAQLQDALTWFHQYQTIFKELGICPDGFALPRQLTCSLFCINMGFWGIQWSLFIYHWVEAYYSYQAAMVTFKPLQCFRPDVTYKSMPWQNSCCSHGFYQLQDAQWNMLVYALECIGESSHFSTLCYI